MQVVEVPAERTWELRRRVLRDGSPDADVRFGGDDAPGAFHLAVVDESAQSADVIAVGSFSPTTAASTIWQLRGMAVDHAHQGQGLGRAVLSAAASRLRQAGAMLLWANVRDSAAGFYERAGWTIVGGGFNTEIGLPHHVGVLPLETVDAGNSRSGRPEAP